MKQKVSTQSGFFTPRALVAFLFCFAAIALCFSAFSLTTGTQPVQSADSAERGNAGKPQERTAVRTHRSFEGDVRLLPYVGAVKKERPEREPPRLMPQIYQPARAASIAGQSSGASVTSATASSAPAPAPIKTFDGLDYATWGAGHPPDPNGDVGPTYYIQTVNTSIGIYDKATGVRVAAFTFDTFMSQGQFGNLCDTDNFGDPVVLYDTFEDRWIITDFAFKIDNSGNVINPPGAFQCFAVSKTGDPVNGGWNFYSINTTGGLGDYPKFGVWPDGIYMSVNMFDYAAAGSFQNVRVYALNKAQMYAGASTVQVISFNVDPTEFTLLPSNARLQSGTPPPGRPNLFISTWKYVNALTVYKFHVNWSNITLSSFTGPDIPLTGSSWPYQSVGNAATPANSLDTLGIRAMAQNQYSNIVGTESLWTTHTVRRATNGFATPRWYQVNVTGGTVAGNTLQTASWDPDGANVSYRYIPSLAVDRAANLALGYTTSNSTTDPGLKYAGRLSTDAANTFSRTEQTLWQGTGSQNGNCGGSPCTRWGDYSAMTLDPDGCTFWYTNEYYAVTGLNYLTRIGAFKYSQCTPVGNGGTVSGQVTVSGSGTPIGGAIVALGSRTTTTNGSGNYSFNNIPAGTYPNITASAPGYNSATQSPVVVTDNATTTKNFALTLSAPPATDLNGDRKPDYILFNAGTRQTAVWYLNNYVFLGSALIRALPAGWNLVDVADYDGDQRGDFWLFNPTTRQTVIWHLSNASYVYYAVGPTLPSGWQLAAVGDFNRDQHPDLVLFNPTTLQTAIWFLSRNALLNSAYGPSLASGWRIVGAVDFDRNGSADYLLFNPSTRQTVIWYFSGRTRIAYQGGPTIATGYVLSGAADFDRNGRQDYLLFNPATRQTVIWYLNGNLLVGSRYGPTLPAGWTLAAP